MGRESRDWASWGASCCPVRKTLWLEESWRTVKNGGGGRWNPTVLRLSVHTVGVLLVFAGEVRYRKTV